MATLEQKINLTREAWFRKRVRMATVRAAVDIQGESPENIPTAKYAKRQELAHKVITTAGEGTPTEDLNRMFVWACANDTLTDTWLASEASEDETDSIPDGDLQFTVNSVWDDCAGVTGTDSVA